MFPDREDHDESAESPDYVKGSPEDRRSDAPTAKAIVTDADKELDEDQAVLQTDSE